MRKRIEIVARLDHPVEIVFAYLTDPLRWPEFAPAVVLRRQLDEGPSRVGTRWRAIDRIGPFHFSFTDELAEHEPSRRVVWKSSSPWNARTEYACQADGAGTVLRACYEGDVAGWLRPLSWVPAAVIGWFLARDFKRLRGTLGRSQPAPQADGAVETSPRCWPPATSQAGSRDGSIDRDTSTFSNGFRPDAGSAGCQCNEGQDRPQRLASYSRLGTSQAWRGGAAS